MWSGPSPTFCTATSCLFFIVCQHRIIAEARFSGKACAELMNLFASLHQGAVAAGGSEQREEGQNRQRKQHDIERKCLNHQVGAEHMVDQERPHTFEDVGMRAL